MITTWLHMWIPWGRIAVRSEGAAWTARQRANALHNADKYCGDELEEEMEATLVAVTATANALEAIYGGLHLRARNLVRPPSERPDWRKVLRSIGAAFDLDPATTQSWASGFKELFAVKRNAVVHFRETPGRPTLHPVGVKTTPELCEYTLEVSAQSVELLLEVLAVTGASSSRTPELQRYGDELRNNAKALGELRKGRT